MNSNVDTLKQAIEECQKGIDEIKLLIVEEINKQKQISLFAVLDFLNYKLSVLEQQLYNLEDHECVLITNTDNIKSLYEIARSIKNKSYYSIYDTTNIPQFEEGKIYYLFDVYMSEAEYLELKDDYDIRFITTYPSMDWITKYKNHIFKNEIEYPSILEDRDLEYLMYALKTEETVEEDKNMIYKNGELRDFKHRKFIEVMLSKIENDDYIFTSEETELIKKKKEEIEAAFEKIKDTEVKIDSQYNQYVIIENTEYAIMLARLFLDNPFKVFYVLIRDGNEFTAVSTTFNVLQFENMYGYKNFAVGTPEFDEETGIKYRQSE